MESNAAFELDYFTNEGIYLRPGTKLKEIEKIVILRTLQDQKYNRTHTAKVLGIGIRTLQRKLKQYREGEAQN